jgi:RimJ/RimL family protein N-acetyltransferase
MVIELRDAVPEDAADLIDLRRTIFGESDFMLYAPDEYADSTDAMAKRIEGISRSSGSRLIVALADRALAGFLSVAGNEIPRRRHVGYVVIGVVRAHWSSGIGGALLKEALRWAPTAGIARLELGVMTENARAIRLYERLGFRVEGTKRGAYLIGGRPVDEHFMACLIET